jgi:hypothetical protein
MKSLDLNKTSPTGNDLLKNATVLAPYRHKLIGRMTGKSEVIHLTRYP